MSNADFPNWFRGSAPYIHGHRGRTFVVALPEAALEDGVLARVCDDLAALHTLGIHLVVVLAAEQTLAGGHAIPASEIGRMRDSISGQRVHVEASLSTAAIRIGTPAVPHVVSGNHVMARPRGVIDGVDQGAAGVVRRIDHGAITQLLASGALVLVPPIAGSPRGETFVLDGLALARELATSIRADKLISYASNEALTNKAGERLSEITPAELDVLLSNGVIATTDEPPARALGEAARAGVSRCHLIGWNSDGSLLRELFTREGCGTQITEEVYLRVRAGTQADAPAVAALIEPFIVSGALRPREIDELEDDAAAFSLVELDGLVVGCAALHSVDPTTGELACFATHPEYRKHRSSDVGHPGKQRSVGATLLDAVVSRARQQRLERLIVLTTQAEHWFLEHGFERINADELPATRRSEAEQTGRASHVLAMDLIRA